jgi:phosphotransferase system enzyme I (PtsP)
VSNRFDTLSAGFLRALKTIADVGRKHNKPVTLCGEIGGRPLEAMTLVALGYRGLSMSAAAIGPIKAMVLSLDAGQAAREVEAILADSGDAATLRGPLRALSERLGVRL